MRAIGTVAIVSPQNPPGASSKFQPEKSPEMTPHCEGPELDPAGLAVEPALEEILAVDVLVPDAAELQWRGHHAESGADGPPRSCVDEISRVITRARRRRRGRAWGRRGCW